MSETTFELILIVLTRQTEKSISNLTHFIWTHLVAHGKNLASRWNPVYPDISLLAMGSDPEIRKCGP